MPQRPVDSLRHQKLVALEEEALPQFLARLEYRDERFTSGFKTLKVTRPSTRMVAFEFDSLAQAERESRN
jgi:hypothetical protein